jgi:type I restriction enzyme S subunit
MTQDSTEPMAWPTLRFDQFAENIVERVDPAEADADVYVGLEHLDPESLKIRRWGTPDDVEGEKLRFRAGDVIFGRRRFYQRKLAVAEFDGICSAHAMVLRARESAMLQEFLPFFLQSETFFQRAMQISVGSLSPTINWRELARQEFAVPPLDEQRRIAEILWAADEAVTRFESVFQTIRELLASMRIEKFGKGGGRKTHLASLCVPDGIQIGPFGSQLHASDYVEDEDGVPVVMPSDMSEGRVLEDSIARISPEMAEKMSKHKVLPGDILLPRRGELDRRAFVEPEQSGWICGTGSIRIRLKDSVPARAVFHALAAPQTVSWLERSAVGTTMPNLNSKIVSNIPVRLPQKEELLQAIEALDSLQGSLQLVQGHIEVLKSLKSNLTNALVPQ